MDSQLMASRLTSMRPADAVAGTLNNHLNHLNNGIANKLDQQAIESNDQTARRSSSNTSGEWITFLRSFIVECES